MMASMKLEPYTVPEQDADLWGCGVVLDPSPPVEIRAANDRPTGRDRPVWAVMCEHETATFAELVKLTKMSPYRVGTSLMRLAALGTIRPVGDVGLCSNNEVSMRSRWTLCGPDERRTAGASWRDRVKQNERAIAEANSRWWAEQKAEWEANRERCRVAVEVAAAALAAERGVGAPTAIDVPVRTLPGGVRIAGSALPPDRE